jgi:hypothetical protein
MNRGNEPFPLEREHSGGSRTRGNRSAFCRPEVSRRNSSNRKSWRSDKKRYDALLEDSDQITFSARDQSGSSHYYDLIQRTGSS